MGNSSSHEQNAGGGKSNGKNPPKESKASYYKMAKDGYQQLINAIIRPPRCVYTISQLGPQEFPFCGRYIERRDFVLTNPRGHKLQASWWQPIGETRPHSCIPCVVYMHGNSSSRVEAVTSLSPVLSLGASMLAFDFSGSGQSEGEYVSLGHYEKEDLQVQS